MTPTPKAPPTPPTPPTERERGYAVGWDLFRAPFDTKPVDLYRAASASADRLSFLEGAVAGTCEALADACPNLLDPPEWPDHPVDRVERITEGLAMTLLLLNRGPDHDAPDRLGLALVDTLLVATARDERAATDLSLLRAKCLREIDKWLLFGHFNALVAQRVGFGSRGIRALGGGGALPFGSSWTHPTQVDVALRCSDLGQKAAKAAPASDVLSLPANPAAMKHLLDVWPWPTLPMEADSAASVVYRQFTRQPPRATQEAVDVLCILRDHPRTKEAFWDNVLDTRSLDPRSVQVFEVLAAESAGPAAEALLRKIAENQDENWEVPAEASARAAVRLAARQSPHAEMQMP